MVVRSGGPERLGGRCGAGVGVDSSRGVPLRVERNALRVENPDQVHSMAHVERILREQPLETRLCLTQRVERIFGPSGSRQLVGVVALDSRQPGDLGGIVGANLELLLRTCHRELERRQRGVFRATCLHVAELMVRRGEFPKIIRVACTFMCQGLEECDRLRRVLLDRKSVV